MNSSASVPQDAERDSIWNISPKYVPTTEGMKFSRNTVGPATNRKNATTAASTMLKFESLRIPLATPETAEIRNTHVSTAMIAISTALPTSPRPVMICRPRPICSVPNPRDAEVAKRMPTIANMSMSRPPTLRCARWPKIADISRGRPRR